jgi:hypothetical protein
MRVTKPSGRKRPRERRDDADWRALMDDDAPADAGHPSEGAKR